MAFFSIRGAKSFRGFLGGGTPMRLMVRRATVSSVHLAPESRALGALLASITVPLKSYVANVMPSLAGVSSVLIAKDYVTVVKTREENWEDLEDRVRQCIVEQLTSGVPAISRSALSGHPPSPAESGLQEAEGFTSVKTCGVEEEDLSASIRELLYMRARPMLQADGGDLEMIRFDEETGVVWVYLKGSCQGCPSSLITLKRGMKQMLQYYIPEVEDVRQCDENGEPLEDEADEE